MINNYASIFEILVALNLGYTSSKTLRGLINKELFKLNKLKNRLLAPNNKYEEELKVLLADEVAKQASIKIDIIKKDYHEQSNTIVNKSKDSLDFPKGIKSIFFMSTLYCFFILLLGSYEQFYQISDETPEKFSHANILLTFMNLTFVFNIIAFGRNCIYRHCTNNVKNSYVIVFFLIPLASYILFYIYGYLKFQEIEYIPSFRFNITISLLMASSAFLLFSIRLLIVKYTCKSKLFICNRKIKKRINEIEKSYENLMNSIFK